jgi:arylsulfatase A-like enzyme
LQVDWTVGQVVEALERNGIGDQTLIIFTSDNGCSPQANYEELAAFGHNPSYQFRGHKADIFEGGHRVPFILRWPESVKAGSKSNQVTCLTDLMATVAAIVQDTLPEDAGPDSYNMLPAMLGADNGSIREATVHHSINGSFAIRKGKWKLIMCPDSGGWSAPKPGSPEAEGLPPVQLYDLEADIGETENLQEQYPEVVDELKGLLKSYISSGRSTPGPELDYVTPDKWPGTSWMSNEVASTL